MNTKKVIKELKSQYPGKTIILNPEDRPSEVLCEVDPSTKHPAFSVVVAVIDKSAPHIHKLSTEKYEVIKGTLIIFKDNEKYVLGVGESLEIWPNEIHFATGNGTCVKVTSRPGWTFEDHILTEE